MSACRSEKGFPERACARESKLLWSDRKSLERKKKKKKKKKK